MSKSSETSRQAVVNALLEYATVLRGSDNGDFTGGHAEANNLLWTNPFAFLLGVVFDQSVGAGQAWRAPYLLRQRLGHLDPARMADDPALSTLR